MNKKFSTLVAALMAAGALVMPAEMFAQLRYANGATYENVKTSTKLPNANKTSTYFWVLQDEEGKDYVAIVENNTLIAKPFLAATMNDVIKVTTNTKATSFIHRTSSSASDYFCRNTERNRNGRRSPISASIPGR